MERNAVEQYLEADAPVIKRRRQRWGVWTQSADAARERQRRHRLRETVRPTEPAGEWVDPWEVAKKALDDVHRVRQALRSQVTARAHLEDVAEAIRVLAWGPEDQGSRP